MTNQPLDKIKARIKALSERTVDRGCTESEASHAAALMGKLLQDYCLSMNDVDVRAAKCSTLSIKSGSRMKGPMHNVVGALGHFADCKIWYMSNSGEIVYNFFGTESDLQAVEYLYRVIEQSLETSAAFFKTTSTYALSSSRRSATHSFKVGLVIRVGQRLREMKAERDAAMHASAVTGSALVVLKNQVVTDEFARLNLRTTMSRVTASIRDREATAAGREAGNRVNLGRPIGAASGGLAIA